MNSVPASYKTRYIYRPNGSPVYSQTDKARKRRGFWQFTIIVLKNVLSQNRIILYSNNELWYHLYFYHKNSSECLPKILSSWTLVRDETSNPCTLVPVIETPASYTYISRMLLTKAISTLPSVLLVQSKNCSSRAAFRRIASVFFSSAAFSLSSLLRLASFLILANLKHFRCHS